MRRGRSLPFSKRRNTVHVFVIRRGKTARHDLSLRVLLDNDYLRRSRDRSVFHNRAIPLLNRTALHTVEQT